MVSEYDQSSFVYPDTWHMWKISAYMENTVAVFFLGFKWQVAYISDYPQIKRKRNEKLRPKVYMTQNIYNFWQKEPLTWRHDLFVEVAHFGHISG